jgi:DNA-binding MurR/RpiR family transcriptional regulator
MALKQDLQQLVPGMTTVERRIATVVLSDFPYSGLGTIQELAAKAQVSAPSITRLVSKLGFAGYQEFQRQLIDELKESARAPVDLRFIERPAVDEGFLGQYFGRVGKRIEEMRRNVSEDDFRALCALLGDHSRAVYVIGGRVSQGLAHVMAVNLQFMRPEVHLLPSDPEQWPNHVQRMKKRDVLLIVDFRRYQKSLERLAELAAEAASPQIVLVTDQWLSPISRCATRTFALPIAVGTAWDSYAAPLALMEAAVVVASEQNWDATCQRIAAWDRLRINPEDPATPILPDASPR